MKEAIIALAVYCGAGSFLYLMVDSAQAQTSPTSLERMAQAIDRNTRAQEAHTRELRNLTNAVNAKCR